MRWCCAVALAIVIATAPARADNRDTSRAAGTRVAIIAQVPEDPDNQPAWNYEISTKRRIAAVALAIFPGVIVHGIGAWTVRQKRAAYKIVSGQAIGIALAAMAGGLVGGSGGNPYTIIPGVPLVVAGGGLLMQSWFTDIWVAAGGEKIVEQPRAPAPWSVELGTSWLHDAYRERALLRGGGRIELGRVDLGAAAIIDAAGDAQLGEANVALRILGTPASGALVDDGSRLSVRVGTRVHRDAPDRVTQWTQEFAIDGRLDLAHIDRAFGKSFVEAGTGIGVVRVDYGDVEHEWSSELLARFAWGAYLGSRGEATLFYEHTRDGLVGGLPAWRAAGFLGNVGATLDLRVRGPWALRGELAIGNAWLTTLGIAYRGGPQ
ncbi:MAG TPA: hypothetical protein VIV11_10670 [Kofleriaceae bacterium]